MSTNDDKKHDSVPLEKLRVTPEGGATLEFEYGPCCGRQVAPSVAVRKQEYPNKGPFYGGVLLEADVIRLHDWLGEVRKLLAKPNRGFASQWWEAP